MKKLTLMLLVAVMLNSPAAEAVFIPLSLQPGGSLNQKDHNPRKAEP